MWNLHRRPEFAYKTGNLFERSHEKSLAHCWIHNWCFLTMRQKRLWGILVEHVKEVLLWINEGICSKTWDLGAIQLESQNMSVQSEKSQIDNIIKFWSHPSNYYTKSKSNYYPQGWRGNQQIDWRLAMLKFQIVVNYVRNGNAGSKVALDEPGAKLSTWMSGGNDNLTVSWFPMVSKTRQPIWEDDRKYWRSDKKLKYDFFGIFCYTISLFFTWKFFLVQVLKLNPTRFIQMN